MSNHHIASTQTWAITGGIGSGKTTVCRLIEERYALPIFYCDDEAKHIIRTHAGVKKDLCALIGTEVYSSEGQLCKAVLGAYIRQSKAHAARVNAIVHPRVAEAWHTFCQGKPFALMECALLFESGFDHLVQHTIAVVCEHETRIRRIMQRDHIDRHTALQWIALQWPDEQVRDRADYLIDTTSGQAEEIKAQVTQYFDPCLSLAPPP